MDGNLGRWDGWARNAKEAHEELDIDLECLIPQGGCVPVEELGVDLEYLLPPGGCVPAVNEEQEEAQEEVECQLRAQQ